MKAIIQYIYNLLFLLSNLLTRETKSLRNLSQSTYL